MTRDLPHPLHKPNSDHAGDDLTLHAAPRTRIIDDHMFVGAEFGSEQATFRLQLFTAPGARPVAVATQLPQEGASLANMAERYAAVVWRRHCPEEADPPLWIQRLLDGEDGQGAVFERVSFDTVGRHQLANPEWHDLTDDQLHRLVGQVVDGSRGAGYVPPEPEPEAVPVHEVTAVADLPEPHPFRTPNCMPQRGPLQGRLTGTSRAVPGCCWYHDHDWHAVCEQAVRLVQDAQRVGITGRDLAPHALQRARQEATSEPNLEALRTLLAPETAITANTIYTNGQHRVRAMRDAGVERTVTVRWEYPQNNAE
ncbi:hypothetical protein ACIQU6_38470 [Streptomyces sp. NPDC090442]|uniref:hypothetical protein n=1 Tax=Streptomyces sp. NPDC090442 TaxID=3365962 RepID=UPI003810C7EF